VVPAVGEQNAAYIEKNRVKGVHRPSCLGEFERSDREEFRFPTRSLVGFESFPVTVPDAAYRFKDDQKCFRFRFDEIRRAQWP